ncbi:JAB domain-containing protein [Algoriphagus pacificus]|uniref:JAB domain-containing protein n=1 Tax=Algoriphagus pacificus TaxID=2811234 RepID=A0ABS3CLU2_9BACT|nr:JAB domain-containing protein [Algoriphagus pacificus]MBN7817466.1 JAB domain-containing protein [Algoriphagus pacificus]
MEAVNQVINLHQVAEITLGYSPKVKSSQRPKVGCSRQVYEVLYNFWDKDTLELAEHFQVMLLNRANRVLGICTISKGGTAGTVVDAKLVFATALKGAAQSIVVSHNHPSGNLIPSEQDKRITRRLVEIGKVLDLPVLDHVIVTADGYYSFADEGEL